MKLILLLFFVACASKPNIYSYGSHGELKIQDDVYAVAFDSSDLDHSHKMIYVKCSEVTLQKGFRYFSIVQWKREQSTIILDHIFEINDSNKITHVIQFSENPVAGRENFDAYVIYHNHLKAIKSFTDS